MRHKILLGTVVAATIFSCAASDPVLMKINGKDVKLSEFEYLYNKNKQQQLEKETLEQYVDRFVTYKLKVAAAEDAGIDTTQVFIKEFNSYKDELAKPYLNDGTTNKRLAHEAYQRMTTDRDVCHIMLPLNVEGKIDNKAKLDSIRNCILTGGDFEELARKYSIDPSVKRNGGDLGYITVGRLPYVFEKVAYATPVGSVSEAFATDFGYHIIRIKDERPNRGKVNVEHILKLYPRTENESLKALAKHQMDSIYALVVNGGDFEKLATEESDDKGSAQKGGALPWFGTGEMVPQFENVAFALADGEISKPFETSYGVHIIKKLGSKPLESYSELEGTLLKAIESDSRSQIAMHEKAEKLCKAYKLKENKKLADYFKAEIASNGGYDSLFVNKMKTSNEFAYSFANKKFNVSSFAGKLDGNKKLVSSDIVPYMLDVMKISEEREVIAYEKEMLKQKYPEYKNLLNEYRDGMLLFEVSNSNVWDKAARDDKGLSNYFERHKSNYVWTASKFKGYILNATNDSIAKEVLTFAKNIGEDTLANTLRKKFKRDIKIEKVLVAKGENAKVDELIFNNGKAVASKPYNVYCVLTGKVIDSPEEYADVKGQVTSDYQNELETQWDEMLHKKYNVEINPKVVKAVK